MMCPPWVVVPAAERDILVDRVGKEIAPLLGAGGGGGGRGSGLEGGVEGEEEEEGVGRRRRRGKVFSARQGVSFV